MIACLLKKNCFRTWKRPWKPKKPVKRLYPEIDGKCELDDAGVGAVIAKEMKQRKESLAEFEKAGRSDLVEETKAEMAVLEKYMPKQLTADEIRQIVNEAVAGQSGLKMGDVMKLVMPKVKGKADGKLVSQIVREILQKN